MTMFTIDVTISVILFLHISQVLSYSFFRDRIPNGHNVPNPCEGNSVWWGVGHENPNGGGDRNPFGVHFQQLGMKWDSCLCELDSDGDGRSNGEELGDPNCEFVAGETPSRTTGITHPGICEPLDDHSCMDRNSFLTCHDSEPFSCPEFANASVRSVNLTLNRTQVPAVGTTYICQIFDLPTDGDYSMIGSTPIIDNVDVLHHIVLYGCADDVVPQLRPDFVNPNPACGMIPNICTQIIAGWTIGLPGECFQNNYGFRIGIQGLKSVIMQLHWNNPLTRSDYTDASGLTLYYTPNRRPNDAAVFFLGTEKIIIPPQQNGVVQYGLCPAECTRRMLQNSTIYVTTIIPHMHYLGRGMAVSVKKNGSDEFKVVLDFQTYNYDSPKVFAFDPPLQLSPGDEVNVSCVYVSVNSKSYTFYGMKTSNEMCYAITTYYPYQQTVGFLCAGAGTIADCADILVNGDHVNVSCYQGSRFWNDSMTAIKDQVYTHCDVANGLNCTAACETVIKDLNANYSECLNSDFRQAVLYRLVRNSSTRGVALGLLSCEPKRGLGDINIGGSGVNTSCLSLTSSDIPTSSGDVSSTSALPVYGQVLTVIIMTMAN